MAQFQSVDRGLADLVLQLAAVQHGDGCRRRVRR
jgi:hypothetical protein